MGDFEMFKYVIPKMANLFFICNQPNYARYCVKYSDNLNNVSETHPGLENDFINGCFGVKRTDKPSSRIPIDLTLEQTINADAAKRLSGIAHFTNSIAARQRWSKSHSIRAALISHVLDVCGLRYLQDVTADLQPNRIKIYGKQIADFVEILQKNCNPFDPNLDKENLYNIATSKPVSPEIADFLLNIEENGEDLRNQFINECIKDESRFERPIKKNRVFNFADAPKKKKLTLGNKVVELRMQRDLFGRMLGISLTHKVHKVIRVHLWISLILFCSMLLASIRLLCTANMTVSSENVVVSASLLVGRSAVNKRYSKGPSILPCGTPDVIGCSVVISLSYLTRKYLSVRYDLRRM